MRLCNFMHNRFFLIRIKYDKLVKSQIPMAKKKAPPILQNWRGAQILSDDLYLAYYEETKDAAQQRIWTFYEAIKYHALRDGTDRTIHMNG